MPARNSTALVRLSMRLNPLVAAILRSPLHWLLSPGLMLLTVTGRTSGRRYTIPVGYHQTADAVVVMVGEAPSKTWWRNYRAPGPIELRLRGKVARGRAEVLSPTSSEFRRRADDCLRRARLIPWIFGIDFDRTTGLTDEQLRQLGQHAAIVKITIER